MRVCVVYYMLLDLHCGASPPLFSISNETIFNISSFSSSTPNIVRFVSAYHKNLLMFISFFSAF